MLLMRQLHKCEYDPFSHPDNCGFGQFAKVLTTKVFTEYGGVSINGCVIILGNGDSVGVAVGNFIGLGVLEISV